MRVRLDKAGRVVCTFKGGKIARVWLRELGMAEKPKPQPFEAAIKAGKRTLATLRLDALGRTTIDIPPGVLSSGRHEALTKLLKNFLADQPVD